MNEESKLLLGMGLIGAGILLIIVEVFIPSGGLIALTAAVVAVAGVVVLFQADPVWGAAGALALVVLAPAAFFFAMKMLPSTPLGRRLIGVKEPEQEEAERLARERARAEQLSLVGAEGEALTDLRPVGVVRIDGKRYDALAEGKMIEAGQRVRVTVIEHNQIKVRAVAPDHA